MKELRSFLFYSLPVILFTTIPLSLIIMVAVTIIQDYLPHFLRSNMGGWTLFGILFYDVIFCLFSSLILLNLSKGIRQNKVLSFLTFYLPVILLYVSLLLNLDHPDAGFTLMIPIGFLICITYFYVRLRKWVNKGEPDTVV